jgi:hypothetical protein
MSTVQGSSRMITDGLIFYYDLYNSRCYNGTGTSVNDLSNNLNEGSLINGVGFTQSYFSFDGTNDYILINPTAELKSIQVPMTIMGWYWDDGTKLTPTVFSQYLNTTPGNLVKLVRIQSGELTYFKSKSISPGFEVFSLTGSQFNTWNFFSVSVDGNTNSQIITLTLNTNSATFSGFTMATANSAVQLRIGSAESTFQASNEYFSGGISYLSIHNIALPQNQVLDIYNQTKSRYTI